MCYDIAVSMVKEHSVQNFSGLLEKYDLNYQKDDIYFKVGQSTKMQGWILHLSCAWTQIPDLLNTVLPLLKDQEVPFKIITDQGKAMMISNGLLGYHQLGKILCIYPSNDKTAITLVKEMLATTKSFSGCSIPTDIHLGGIVFTRYGSFNPQVYLNDIGRPERWIENAAGQLIKDDYYIPFRFPNGVHWPFDEIVAPTEQKPSAFLNDNDYYVISTLKNDAKGRVMKALRLKGLRIQRTIIKEAKHGVWVDENERDIKDRLFWQYVLLNDLKDKISIPKVYDFFKENNNSYLVMEYVKAKKLGQVFIDTYRGGTWSDLAIENKRMLLDLLLQLVKTIATIHEQGFVHRDINAVNFMIDRKKKLTAIDLELAYSIKSKFPAPPFALGTDGFMSPEQMVVSEPKPNQDIYSLGALMIQFFSNLNPFKFEHHFSGLSKNLDFFIGNLEVSQLITSCLSQKPSVRPSLDTIRSKIKKFRSELNQSVSKATDQSPPPAPDKVAIRQLIDDGIKVLTDSVMVQDNKVWHSLEIQHEDLIVNPKMKITYNIGWYSGVSGVIYVLAKAHNQGHNIEKVKEIYERNFHYLDEHFIKVLPNVIPGLYHGAAGVAMAIAKGIDAKLIAAQYKPMIGKCLEIPTNGLNVVHGTAGQGLATLHCLNYLDPEISDRLLHQYAGVLLDNQQKDGSWLTVSSEGVPAARYTGYAQGVAGICYFLLKYYERYQDDRVGKALANALRWLQKQSKNKKGLYWFTSDRGKFSNLWLNDGVAGVVLCFITAYEILGDVSYRKIAEGALQRYPRFMVHSNFSLANGLAGLGEIYLKAARILGSDEWQQRADFILNLLLNTRRGGEDLCYWIIEDNKNPTADFMVGNSGILHFLLNYLSPKSSSIL